MDKPTDPAPIRDAAPVAAPEAAAASVTAAPDGSPFDAAAATPPQNAAAAPWPDAAAGARPDGTAAPRPNGTAPRPNGTAPRPNGTAPRPNGSDAPRSNAVAARQTPAASRLNLVAGGAGFIGSHLCRALMRRGEAVLCLDNLQTARPSNLADLEGRPGFAFLRHDVIDPLPAAVLAEAPRIARIWNLACAASPPLYQRNPEHTMLTNVVGTSRLLGLAEEAGARFLLTSTSEVYGDPDIHPQAEDYRGNVSCTGPRACYDEGKRAAEALTFDYGRAARAEVRVARIFNTYGPNMDPLDGRVVSNLICQALRGEDLTIYGDGTQTRSFCYVSDMVAGLMALMDAEIDGMAPVNLGNGDEITVSELARQVAGLAGGGTRLVHRPLPVDDPRRRRPDTSRAADLLGWSPRVPLAEGLDRTWHWFAAELQADAAPARPPRAAAAAAG